MAIRRTSKVHKSAKSGSFVVKSAEGGRSTSKNVAKTDVARALSQVRSARSARRAR